MSVSVPQALKPSMESVCAIREFSSRASVCLNALMALLKSTTSAVDVMHHVLLV